MYRGVFLDDTNAAISAVWRAGDHPSAYWGQNSAFLLPSQHRTPAAGCTPGGRTSYPCHPQNRDGCLPVRSWLPVLHFLVWRNALLAALSKIDRPAFSIFYFFPHEIRFLLQYNSARTWGLGNRYDGIQGVGGMIARVGLDLRLNEPAHALRRGAPSLGSLTGYPHFSRFCSAPRDRAVLLWVCWVLYAVCTSFDGFKSR